jgi:hypothetical protein
VPHQIQMRRQARYGTGSGSDLVTRRIYQVATAPRTVPLVKGRNSSMKFLATILLIFLNACGQAQIKTQTTAMNKLEEFKAKVKFTEDHTIHYPGLSDKNLLPTVTEKINLIAEDFKIVAAKETVTDKDYQDKIEIGLRKFSDVYLQLGTRDRERICTYVEELMDIVGLKSSGGHLNKFMYGFNPTK